MRDRPDDAPREPGERFERGRAEESLRRSESRYRSLFESIDEGFCVVRMLFDAGGAPVDYRFLEINPAFERHTGIADAVGLTMRSMVPDHERHWFDIYGRVALTGESIRFQQPAVAMGDRWFDVYAFRVGEPGEHTVAVLFRDDSERRRLLRGLEEADRRKDEFLAMLAHELRNPLAPLRNSLRIVEREPLSMQAQRALEMCGRQVRQLTRLVDDLLEVSRITQGKIGIRPERMMLQRVLCDAAESLAPSVDARGHQLHLELPTRPVWIDADPARIAQVVENLLSNACKYTDPGGTIRLHASDAPDAVTIAVQDDGIGIAREHLPTIFELFAQVDGSLDRAAGGLGIGLALARQLVEMHGGCLHAASDGPGTGSTFTVVLPAGRDARP
jgi:signal transduction histidine kinase